MELQTLEAAKRVRADLAADLDAAMARAASATDFQRIMCIRWNLIEWDRLIADLERQD